MIDQFTETGTVFFKAALQGAHVHALALGNLLDGGPAHGQQQVDGFADVKCQRVIAFAL